MALLKSNKEFITDLKNAGIIKSDSFVKAVKINGKVIIGEGEYSEPLVVEVEYYVESDTNQ